MNKNNDDTAEDELLVNTLIEDLLSVELTNAENIPVENPVGLPEALSAKLNGTAMLGKYIIEVVPTLAWQEEGWANGWHITAGYHPHRYEANKLDLVAVAKGSRLTCTSECMAEAYKMLTAEVRKYYHIPF